MYGWFRLVSFAECNEIAFDEIPAYAGMTINQNRLSVCIGMTNEKRMTNRNRTTNGKRKTIVNCFAPDT
jgi:hypothetical protein